MEETEIKPGLVYETRPAGRYGVSHRLVYKIERRNWGYLVFYRVRRADGAISTVSYTMTLDRFARAAVRVIP